MNSLHIPKLCLFCPWWYLMRGLSWSLSQPMSSLLYFLSSVQLQREVNGWLSLVPGIWHLAQVNPWDAFQDSYNLQTCLVCLQILHLDIDEDIEVHWAWNGALWNPTSGRSWAWCHPIHCHPLCPTHEPVAVFVIMCLFSWIVDILPRTLWKTALMTTEIQKDDYINCLPLIDEVENLAMNGCQKDFPLLNPCWLVNDDCVVLQVFFNNSQNNFLHNFPRHWGKTDRQVITRVIPLALFWKLGCLPAFSPETFYWFYVSVLMWW